MIKNIKVGQEVFYFNKKNFYEWTDPEIHFVIKKIKIKNRDFINENFCFKTKKEIKDFILGLIQRDNITYKTEILRCESNILRNDKLIYNLKLV
jgi:hypothetical protein